MGKNYPLKKFSIKIFLPPILTLSRAFKISGVGTVVTGTVVQGFLRTGQIVKIGPFDPKDTTIKSIHLAISQTPAAVAYEGDYVALNISQISFKYVTKKK